MTVTIPTSELVGLLADTIPFASTADEVPVLNAIRLEWDGKQLHAMSTDRYRIGWSTWDPDDDPDGERQDDLWTTWGSDGDEQWHIFVSLADAKDIVGAYRLGAKEDDAPLTVERVISTAEGEQLMIERSRLTGYSAITMVVRGVAADPDPDIRGLLARHDATEPVKEIAFGAKLLADFSKVRPRGPLRLTFTGETRVALVAIGERFVGAIQPVKEEA